MTTEAEQLLKSIRKLSSDDRSQLVHSLRNEAGQSEIEAWEKADQEAWDREGIEEAERRAEEMERDPSVCLDWDTVFQETKERLKKKSQESVV